MRLLDHIVYTVPDLPAAMEDLARRLGVQPVIGGRHDTQGTKNALINLDNGAYFEILAADDTNTAIPPPRWMGVDVLTRPQITRWALKSDDLAADGQVLQAYHPGMGRPTAGSRQRPDGSWLRWTLNLPLPTPEVEVVPFMVDWSASEVHPHDVLPDMGCRLVSLVVLHPEPEKIKAVLAQLNCELEVRQADAAGLRLEVRGPSGAFVVL
ncbi:MAG: VOC family protein [Bacteroidota bacterium]